MRKRTAELMDIVLRCSDVELYFLLTPTCISSERSV